MKIAPFDSASLASCWCGYYEIHGSIGAQSGAKVT